MKKKSYICVGAGEPVLMLHSSMSSKSQWKGLIERLSADYQVIALDLIGYGEAPFPAVREEYCLKMECEGIDWVLDEVGLGPDEKIHVIGHSFGGATALRWAYDHQSRIRSLHLFEPVAFHLLEQPCEGLQQILGVVEKLNTLFNKGEERSACEAFIDYWSGPGAFGSFPEPVQEAMVKQTHKVILDFEALLNEPLRLKDYAAFSFPISLIMGTKSPIASRTIAQRLEETIKGVNFHHVECGHMGPITHADIINDIWCQELASL